MNAGRTFGGQNLLVVYTERLEACREFYAGVGLPLLPERHGDGPAHYAAELPGGLVMELYPARPGRTTGRLRLGFTVVDPDREPGEHVLTDPDGRTVVLTVPGRSGDPAGADPTPQD